VFYLRDAGGKDVIYFYVNTDGTVSGENFSAGRHSRIYPQCVYSTAAEEVLRTVGAWAHSALSSKRVDAAIKALLE
jgi:hypothetical protein